MKINLLYIKDADLPNFILMNKLQGNVFVFVIYLDAHEKELKVSICVWTDQFSCMGEVLEGKIPLSQNSIHKNKRKYLLNDMWVLKKWVHDKDNPIILHTKRERDEALLLKEYLKKFGLHILFQYRGRSI